MKAHTVLAYGSTLAGAQGRTTDTGHVLVTPRTNAASLYVGMTRGRTANHADVLTDGHDHGELDLGHKSGFHGFADAIRRNPAGETSATTVRKDWIAAEAERSALRSRDRKESYNRSQWNNAKRGMPREILAQLAGRDDEIIRAIEDSPTSFPFSINSALEAVDWTRTTAPQEFLHQISEYRVSAPAAGPSSAPPDANRRLER